MSLETLKSEALKLDRVELFDFAQFILDELKQQETGGKAVTPNWLKTEIERRAGEMKAGKNSNSSEETHQEIISKHGFDLPTPLAG